MLAVQRTAGNAAASRLAAPVQRLSLKKTLKGFGQAMAGPYGRLAHEGLKKRRSRGKAPASPRTGSYESELFGREATKSELEKVASIVVASLRRSRNLERFYENMRIDLRADTRMKVHERLSLLYMELFMQQSCLAGDLQRALQGASYLQQARVPGPLGGDQYVQSIFDSARDRLQDKTAPLKQEEAEKSPMERIAEALEALAGGKAAAPATGSKGAASPSPVAAPTAGASAAGADMEDLSWLFEGDQAKPGKAGPSSSASASTPTTGDTRMSVSDVINGILLGVPKVEQEKKEDTATLKGSLSEVIDEILEGVPKVGDEPA
jgi:hypothetical protein